MSGFRSGGAQTHEYRDLGGAETYERDQAHGAAALADSSRTHALHTALLATAHADRGDLDEACAYGDRAVMHAVPVQSRRVRQRITELAQRLHPHRGVPVVAAFFDRHRDALAAT